MVNKRDCKIVQDLLPNYLEKLTNEETNYFIEEHLKGCSECQSLLEEMKKQFSVNFEKRDNQDVEYIKKFKTKMSNLKLFATVMLIIAVVEVAVIFIFRYKQMRDELIATHEDFMDSAVYIWNITADYEGEIDKLRKELSKYDESYKEQIENSFIGDLEEISEENGITKLRVKRVSNTVKAKYELVISENTEIVFNNDVVDVSLLKEGQFLNVHFITDELDKYPEEMTNVKSIEIIANSSLGAEITEINKDEENFAISINGTDGLAHYVYVSDDTQILKNGTSVSKSELQVGQTVEIRYPGLNGNFPQTLSGITKIEIVE